MVYTIPLTSLVPTALAASATANHAGSAILYATSYTGGIICLSLESNDAGHELKQLSTAGGCGANSVWLEQDNERNLLYCSDKAGTIGIFGVNESTPGVLEPIMPMNTSYAPVAITLFDVEGQRVIAFAQYGSTDGGPPGPAGITIYVAGADGGLQLSFNLTMQMTSKGPNTDRQNAPHIHQVLTDPTGKFMAAPDLGEDAVHLYRVRKSPYISSVTSIQLSVGSGPRHAVFQKTDKGTFFHMVSELANAVTSFNVSYDGNNSISMTQIGQVSTFGDKTAPAGALAGEIIISPDGFITVSNRLDNSFKIPSINAPTKAENSDSLAVFKPDEHGELSFVNLYPVGCQSPRQIQANHDGSLLAAACMANDRVVVLERNNVTGEIGSFVANHTVKAATFIGWNKNCGFLSDCQVPMPLRGYSQSKDTVWS